MNPSWKPMPTNSIQTYFPDMPTDTDFMEKITTQTIKRVSVITTDTFPDNGKLLNLREAHIALEIFIVVTTSLKKYCQSLKPAPFPEQKRKYANTSEKCISCAHTNISNASVHTVISLLSRLPYPTKWNRW